MYIKKKDLVETVIFDFDGVILESDEIKTEAFLELFSDYPEHHHAILNYHLEHQGITRYSKFEWIYGTLLKKEYTDEIGKKLGESFSSLVVNKILTTPFVPGALEFLNFLKNKKTPSFIASGTPDKELQSIIESRSLETFFNQVYGSDLQKEEIVSLIMQQQGFSNSDLLFIGDAISDYKAASATGVNFIARNTPVMKEYWKKYSIDSVDNLLDIKKIYDF